MILLTSAATFLPWLWIIAVGFVTSDTSEVITSETPTTTSTEKIQHTQEDKETFKGILNFTLHAERAISEIVESGENVVFSPINIIAVLGTLLLGTEGISKHELLETFEVSKCSNDSATREEVLHKVLGEVLSTFLKENLKNPSINVTVVKSIFVQNGIEVKEDFKNHSNIIYGSQFQSIDFTSPNAADILNQWVSKETDGHIKELIPPPLSPDLKMVIASALYFDGEWDKPFYENTTWANFNTGSETVQVQLMENRGTIRVLYDVERKFQVLGIPYKGKNVVMYILYPDEGVDLTSVLQKLTADDLYEIPKQSMEEREVGYYVPLMNLQACIDLKRVLKKLNLESIFDSSKANLSRISDNLFVSEAIHKITVEITEAGTLGTASTALDLESRFPYRDVIINRPFLFYIYHKPSSAITFWGTIKKPVPFRKIEPTAA